MKYSYKVTLFEYEGHEDNYEEEQTYNHLTEVIPAEGGYDIDRGVLTLYRTVDVGNEETARQLVAAYAAGSWLKIEFVEDPDEADIALDSPAMEE